MKNRDYFSFERVPGAIPELDGLRALAMFFVFLVHATTPYWSVNWPMSDVFGLDVLAPFLNLNFGLEMFFALSGFLIFLGLVRQFEREGSAAPLLASYATNRILRILPAYLAVVLLIASGIFSDFYPVKSADPAASILKHLLFMQDYVRSDLSSTFWALSSEVKFYVLAPVVVWLVYRAGLARLRYWVFGALFLVPLCNRWVTPVAADDFVTLYQGFRVGPFRNGFHFYFDSFMAGGIVALLYLDRARLALLRKSWAACAFLWTGALMLTALVFAPVRQGYVDGAGILYGGRDQVFEQSYINVAIALVFLGVLLGAGSKAFLNSRICLFYARISYSFYLLHVIALYASYKLWVIWYDCFWGVDFNAVPKLVSWAHQVFGGLILATVAALVLHFAVERPCLSFKERSRKSSS